MKNLTKTLLALSLTACGGSGPTKEEIIKANETEAVEEEEETSKIDSEIFRRNTTVVPEEKAFKLTSDKCIDPDLSKVGKGTSLMLCAGDIAEGTYVQSEKIVEVEKEVIVNTETIVEVESTIPQCDEYGQIDCISNNSFKSIDLTNLTVGVLKNGVSINGVTGQYPSSSYLLASSTSVADLNTATFDAKIKSSDSFEWFDASGNRHTSTGDADITEANVKLDVSVFGTVGTASDITPSAQDLRAGVTVGSVTGKLKTQCRNHAFTSQFSLPNTGAVDVTIDPQGGGSTPGDRDNNARWWDTIEDAGKFTVLAYQQPLDWTTDNACGPESWEIQTDVSACDTDGDFCAVKDLNSGLTWANQLPSDQLNLQVKWDVAVNGCRDLDFAGQTDWRLPTQKELMQAYVNGIARTGINAFLPVETIVDQYDFWSSTTTHGNHEGTYLLNNAYSVWLSTGVVRSDIPKTMPAMYMCVR